MTFYWRSCTWPCWLPSRNPGIHVQFPEFSCSPGPPEGQPSLLTIMVIMLTLPLIISCCLLASATLRDPISNRELSSEVRSPSFLPLELGAVCAPCHLSDQRSSGPYWGTLLVVDFADYTTDSHFSKPLSSFYPFRQLFCFLWATASAKLPRATSAVSQSWAPGSMTVPCAL